MEFICVLLLGEKAMKTGFQSFQMCTLHPKLQTTCLLFAIK